MREATVGYSFRLPPEDLLFIEQKAKAEGLSGAEALRRVIAAAKSAPQPQDQAA